MTDQPRIVAAAEMSQPRQGTVFDEIVPGAPLKLLFSSILHELHQPLVAIRLLADSGRASCEDGSNSAEKLRELFEGVGESVELTIRTIGRLRSFVKGMAPTLSRTDVNGAIAEVLRLAEVVARQRGIKIIESLEPNLGPIWADRGALQQAFLNLVFNAIEAIEEQSIRRVVVGTRMAGDRIEIIVSDTGCGIEAEHRDRVFEPEFTTKPQGSGLGLGIVRDIIMQHGGSISLLRSKRGKGTSFCVTLPMGTRRCESIPFEAVSRAEASTARGSVWREPAVLSRLDRSIAQGEQRIADQEILLRRSDLAGDVLEEGERSLHNMNDTLLLWRTLREALRDAPE
jgi:anti-sigma regulatory factor (Ser/Thr protein kinase)